jgi:hypothetical protein
MSLTLLPRKHGKIAGQDSRTQESFYGNGSGKEISRDRPDYCTGIRVAVAGQVQYCIGFINNDAEKYISRST